MWWWNSISAIGRIWRASDWAAKLWGIGTLDEAAAMPVAMGSLTGCASLGALGILFVFVIGLLISYLLPVVVAYRTPPLPIPKHLYAPSFWPDGPRYVPNYRRFQDALEAAASKSIDFPSEDGTLDPKIHDGVPLAPPSGRQVQLDPGAPPLSSSSPYGSTAGLDEARMQQERLNAIANRDMAKYNNLIEEHRKLYELRGVDPCKSGFFPQGCSQ